MSKVEEGRVGPIDPPSRLLVIFFFEACRVNIHIVSFSTGWLSLTTTKTTRRQYTFPRFALKPRTSSSR